MRSEVKLGRPEGRIRLWGLVGLSVLLGALVLLKPPAGVASAPEGRFRTASNTVYDNVTKLTWQRTLGSFDGGAQHFNWEDAGAHCQTLSLEGGNWRLPTRPELESLVDTSRGDTAIDTAVFPKTTSWFWSATPYALAPLGASAWVVSFASGHSGYYSVSTLGCVRCVR